MPDWLTHSLFGWIIGKTTKMDIGLIVVGALIPDTIKIGLGLSWIGVEHNNFLYPLHTPLCALIIGGIFSLLFSDSKKAFQLLGIGIISHFILDLFLEHVYGGIKIFFPFSWQEWQMYLIRSDDYFVTIFAVSYTHLTLPTN